MIRPLASLVKDIIEQQSSKVDPVANFYGSPLVLDKGEQSVNVGGSWRIHYLNTLETYSPDAILNKVSSIQLKTAPIISSIEGILNFSTIDGTSMASTVVKLPQSLGFGIAISAPNKQIALYLNETIVRRGTNSLETTINLPAGKTPLHVVVYGSASSDVTIQIPSDIPVAVGDYIPITPSLFSGSINTNYVDPRTGAAGISISWYNQENVGGWGVYQVESGTFGVITQVLPVGGRYVLTTNFSGIAPYDSSIVQVAGITLGTIEAASYNDELASLVVTVNAFQRSNIDVSLIHSGILSILNFNHLRDISKVSQADIITFVDTNVQQGSIYSYAVDSYAAEDSSLRSDKTEIISIMAGDKIPPGPITLKTFTIDAVKRLSFTYSTPPDADYLATRATYYYRGSGTGQVVNTSMVTDFGLPITDDSLSFIGTTSGTFYFTTIDRSGNEQYIFSGIAFYWNGSGSTVSGINTAPTIGIAQLADTEMTADPRLFAQFKLTAVDAETPGTVQVQYILMSGTASGWITAPTNPFTVTIGRQNRNAWVRARANDGTLVSDELMGVADYDSTPSVVSVFDRYQVFSGTVAVTGTVDDDTKSLKWYITKGATAFDPTPSSPTLINNLDRNKGFDFSFGLGTGTSKEYSITPYPDLGGLGTPGLTYTSTFSLAPKTHAQVSDRTPDGAVSKKNVFVSISSTPGIPPTRIYSKVFPVDHGTVTSGSANTLVDSTRLWPTDQWINDFTVKIVEGKGINQERIITTNTGTTLTVLTNWTEIPDQTSVYFICQSPRLYNDYGKVASATLGSLTTTGSWAVGRFDNKTVTIFSGTGIGQSRTIVSGTISTIYVNPGWTIIPDSTSGYIIDGPISVARDPTYDTTVEFYGEVALTPNFLRESPHSVIIDSDDIPEIKSGSLFEYSPNQLTITLSGIDEDTKYWSSWVRKNNWPTIFSGQSDAVLNDDYKMFADVDASINSFAFQATTGWWYGVVVPYDSYNNPGRRVIFSGQVTGGSTATPIITGLFVEAYDQNSTNQFNRVWWNHNSAAEKPGGNGTATVRVNYYIDIDGPGGQQELTQGTTRYIWQDSEDNNSFSNADDTLNTLLGRGSYLHKVSRGTPHDAVWVVYYYTVQVFNSGNFIQEYKSSIGFYSKFF